MKPRERNQDITLKGTKQSDDKAPVMLGIRGYVG